MNHAKALPLRIFLSVILLATIASCRPAPPSSAPPVVQAEASAVTVTHLISTAQPVSTPMSGQPTSTPAPTLPPPTWTPIADDPYGPADYTVLFTVGFREERYLGYLTPNGNAKLAFPEATGAEYSAFYAPTANGRVLGEDTYGTGGLIVLDLATGQSFKLVPEEGHEAWYSQISPDGRWIAFLDSEGNRRQLRTWEVESGTTYVLTETERLAAWSAFWSSDSSQVYWSLGLPATEACCSGLWASDREGRQARSLTDNRTNTVWGYPSPDARYAAYVVYNPALGETYSSNDMGGGHNEILLVDIPAGETRVLWQGTPPCESFLFGWIGNDQVLGGQSCPDGDSFTREIWLLSLSGEKTPPLWEKQGQFFWATPSPDGQWILVNAEQVDLLHRSTGEWRTIADVGTITWCADGKTIVGASPSVSGFDPYQVVRLDLETGQVTGLWTGAWEGKRADFINVVACR